MFGIFTSHDSQMRSNARNWLNLSDKIYHYRRDILSSGDLADLQKKTETLRGQLNDRVESGKLKLSIEALEPVLRRLGGKFYPPSSGHEWVEFLVVAAIVVLGFRAYFFQPFKIPTNSMWPSYNGMTPEVYHNAEDVPGSVGRAFRFLTLGASHHEVIAPVSGRISVPINLANGRMISQPAKGRTWGVLPATVAEYQIFVGDQPVKFTVPADFNFDWVLRETTGLSAAQIQEKAKASRVRNDGMSWVTLDQTAEVGKPVFLFDILTGDQLFVDRMSYHFVRPSVGSGFVFRTRNISTLSGDQYYVKRLAGVPGDVLEIKPPVLYRNGQPITGAAAFDRNNRREGLYRGYVNGTPYRGFPQGMLFLNQPHTVSDDGYVALGDNSNDSLDSRYWGEVPRKDIVGRPIWVFYPFNKHWGSAK